MSWRAAVSSQRAFLSFFFMLSCHGNTPGLSCIAGNLCKPHANTRQKKHTKPLGDPFEIKNYTVDTCTYINNIIHVYIIVYIYIHIVYIYIYLYIYIYTVYTIHIGLGGNTQFKPSGVEMGDTLRNSKSISGNGSSTGNWGRNISRKVQAGVP